MTVSHYDVNMNMNIYLDYNKIKMQHWEERQRQRLHHNMIQHAKPTIRRYSRSRDKSNMSSSRVKAQSQPNTINMPFKQVLAIFKLQKYMDLLIQHGFPAKIKDRESSRLIDEMLKQVDEEDQDKFLSLMSALLSISAEEKPFLPRRTPILKRSVNRQLPPSHNSTNLKKCDSISVKKTQKAGFRIKSKTQLHRPSVMQTPGSKVTQKSTIPKRSKAKDDSIIVHDFRLKGPSTVKFTKNLNFLQRLQQKLSTLNPSKDPQKVEQAALFYKQIKTMYLSYDTATLTSNIQNIDIEEIIDCFAIEIEQRIVVQSPFKSALNPEDKHQMMKKNQIEELLKESLVQPYGSGPLKRQNGVYVREELESQMDDALSVGSDDDDKTEGPEDSELFDREVQSIAYDLSCFTYQYEDETEGACTRKDIKNFIQLVMMAGKMEKEAPIISYVYIKRVLNVCKKDRISSRNWKNMVLVTLIEASKIWDDQSLQNHSFSKVIAPYTTLEINRLERHLLTLLNYNLKIEVREYCESYFNLRKHASAASKTAHLMPLTLQTIKKLQNGTKKTERSLKESYKKKLNQSF